MQKKNILINSSRFTWKMIFGENSSLEKKLSSFQTWIFFDSYSKWMSLKWPADISDSHILHVPSKLSLFNNRQKKHAQFRMDTTEQGFLLLGAMHGGNFFVKKLCLRMSSLTLSSLILILFMVNFFFQATFLVFDPYDLNYYTLRKC